MAGTRTIAVLGAGSWGTALALHMARLGHPVRLWARDGMLVSRMQELRRNPTYLPDFAFPRSLETTSSLEAALEASAFVVAAIPSHGTRSVLREAALYVPDDAVIVSATKGIEVDTLCRMSEVILDETGARQPVVVLSGPSFALELARQLPTAVCVASSDQDAAERVQHEFRARYFRLYATDDVAGVEIGGAMKNVIAIAAGTTEGLGLGENALSALITRGLAEMSRLATRAGGRPESLAGLSGLGDLVLTCTGSLSRNRRVGVELGQGRQLADILGDMKMVAEGVKTTSGALELGARYDVELPITTQMAEVLGGRTTPRAAVEELMLRPQRMEREIQ